MDKFNNVFTFNNVLILLLGLLLGMGLMDLIQRGNVKDVKVELPDTTYSKVKLDSLTIKIGKHDTTIYNLNIKLKDDVEKVYGLSDSATVELFKELVTSSGTIK